jgi:hypothetical protein
VWLNNYRLACQLGGATTDEVIIRNLPLHLTNSADVAQAPAGQSDPQLGRLGPHLRGELPGHVRAPWELLGPTRVHPEAWRVAPGLHTALLQVLY